MYLKDPKLDLEQFGMQKSEEYQTAQPFPHIVIHDVFSNEVLDSVLDEFPDLRSSQNKLSYDSEHELKLASRGEDHFGPQTKQFLHFLNSRPFIVFLEEMTGIDGLIPDPHFFGGGLHELKNGGFLNIHADFNRHPKMQLDRRLNLLIYLNKGWKAENGGQFELWDKEMKECHVDVVPEYNTIAVFTTTDYSYHGNPNPIKCEENNSRKSIALYYYTNGRPEEEINPGLEDHSTLFKVKPGQVLKASNPKFSIKETIALFIPPIVFKVRDAIFK
ncbi:MAG: 2OG-Fe(II) oxygenase [Thermodesulfobacteriota bacterium]